MLRFSLFFPANDASHEALAHSLGLVQPLQELMSLPPLIALMWKEEAPLLSPDLLYLSAAQRAARRVHAADSSNRFSFLSLCFFFCFCREQDVGGCFQTPHEASPSSLSSYCMSKSAEHCVEHAEEVETRLELFHSLMRPGEVRGVSPPLNPLLPRRERAAEATSSRWKSHCRCWCC